MPKQGAKARPSYLESSLADYRLERLQNGASVAVKRQAGRRIAALRIVLGARPSDDESAREGYAALAFSAAARASLAAGEGSTAKAIAQAGASLRLESGDEGDLALAIECPSESAESLALALACALAQPLFAQGDFDLALREARMAARRASVSTEAEASAPSRGLATAWGSERSLAQAKRENVMRYWSEGFGAQRLSVVVVGDVDPSSLAPSLAQAFGEIPRTAAAVAATTDETSAGTRQLAREEKPALDSTRNRASLRADFPSPRPGSPGYAATAVALALVEERLAESLAASGDSGARVEISCGGSGRASVTIYGTSDSGGARRAVIGALGDIATIAAPAGTTAAITLERCKLRVIRSQYSPLASTAAMAARIGADLASGGDGSEPFRIAERVESVKAADVAAAAEHLRSGPASWAALGDSALLRAF